MSWQFTYSGGLTVWKTRIKLLTIMQQSPCIIAESGDTKKQTKKSLHEHDIALNPWLCVALPFKWELFKQILFHSISN